MALKLFRRRRAESVESVAPVESIAALGPLGSNPVESDVIAAYQATSPLHYWPLNETSGTTAADLVVTNNLPGTAVGMTMGNATAPNATGGGKAVHFSGAGTDYIEVNTDKILGALPAWSVAAWIRYSPATGDQASRAFYGEGANPFVHNWLAVGARAGSGMALFEAYAQGSSTSATTSSSSTIFSYGSWIFVVMTRSGAELELWWNCGRRYHRLDGPTGNSWADTGLKSRIGQVNGAWSWQGDVSHLAIWNRKIDIDADIRPIYQACTPLQRTMTTKKFFAPSAVVNQRLDDPANVPLQLVGAPYNTYSQRLANQVTTYGTGLNASTGPFYSMPAGSPREKVRIAGGQNNIAMDPMAFWNAFQNVPVPHPFSLPVVSDREGQIYSEDTDELWEAIQLQQTLAPPDPPGSQTGTGGTLPAGTYDYAVMGTLADGGRGQPSFWRFSITAGQSPILLWQGCEGADHFVILRNHRSTDNLWRKLATEPGASARAFTDTGADVGVIENPAITNSAVTTDWGCSYGGYLASTDTNLGYFPANHANWGASATSMPLWAGSISLHEMIAAMTDVDAIDHALAIGLPEVDPSFHVYPAQRNDGLSGVNQIFEGIRFQLDPAYDVSQIPYKLDRAIAKALQKYGGFVRDTTQQPSFYVEMNVGFGDRDIYTDVLEGRYAFEVFAGYAFPWNQMRVIDPAWTLNATLATPPLTTVPKFDTLTDTFDASQLDTFKWPIRNNLTPSGGQVRIPVTTGYSANLSSIPNYYDLTSSSIYFEVAGVPTSNASSEGGVQLYASGDLSTYVEMVYTDGGKLVCGYNNSSGVRTRVVQPTYNATAHRWWRIRHASGTVFWEASPDSITWTTLGSVLWSASGHPQSKLEAMSVKFFSGNFGGFSGDRDFVIDNLNVHGAPAEDLTSPIVKIPILVRNLNDPHSLQSMYVDAQDVFHGIVIREPNTGRTMSS